MTDHRVTLANVAGELFELRPMEVFTGSLVRKTHVESDALKLTQFFLIEGADAQVTDELTRPTLPFRHFWF